MADYQDKAGFISDLINNALHSAANAAAAYPLPGSVGGYYDPQNPHGYSIPGGGLLGGGPQVGGGQYYDKFGFDPVSGRIVPVFDRPAANPSVRAPSSDDLLLLLLDA